MAGSPDRVDASRIGEADATVGVISDTHGVLDPRVADAFSGVDHILHAGDVGAPHVLWELQAMAPVTAVLGNMDGAIPGLPVDVYARVAIAGVAILVVHRFLREIERLLPDVSVVVSGHTHAPSIESSGEILYLNPGSASLPRQADGRRTVARLDIRGGLVFARIVPL